MSILDAAEVQRADPAFWLTIMSSTGVQCAHCSDSIGREDAHWFHRGLGLHYCDACYKRLILEPATESVKEPVHDLVNHPRHYNQHPSGIEAITICEHHSFCIGNALKYLWRAEHKGGLEDYKKARWYLNREIERLEREVHP